MREKSDRNSPDHQAHKYRGPQSVDWRIFRPEKIANVPFEHLVFI